jgi:hypothetical protein
MPGRPDDVRYNSLEARKLSFESWPEEVKMNTLDMAIAGGVYEGKWDHIRCFHCGGGMDNWQDNECPKQRHAHMYAGCGYIQAITDTEFIERAASSRKLRDVKDTPDNDLSTTSLCKVCFTPAQAVCFTDCGHVAACVNCTNRLQSCPLCHRQKKFPGIAVYLD